MCVRGPQVRVPLLMNLLHHNYYLQQQQRRHAHLHSGSKPLQHNSHKHLGCYGIPSPKNTISEFAFRLLIPLRHTKMHLFCSRCRRRCARVPVFFHRQQLISRAGHVPEFGCSFGNAWKERKRTSTEVNINRRTGGRTHFLHHQRALPCLAFLLLCFFLNMQVFLLFIICF